MSDPLAKSSNESSPLFDKPVVGGTRAAALTKAVTRFGSNRAKILELLERAPMSLFELAEILGVVDHQISGRITSLLEEGYIERTGERRARVARSAPTPASCSAIPSHW